MSEKYATANTQEDAFNQSFTSGPFNTLLELVTNSKVTKGFICKTDSSGDVEIISPIAAPKAKQEPIQITLNSIVRSGIFAYLYASGPTTKKTLSWRVCQRVHATDTPTNEQLAHCYDQIEFLVNMEQLYTTEDHEYGTIVDALQ